MTTTVTTYQAERDRTLSVIGSGVALRDENCGGSAESMGRIATLVPHGERRVRHRDGGDHHLRQQGSPAITGVNDPRMRFCANDGPATPWYEVSNCTKPVRSEVHLQAKRDGRRRPRHHGADDVEGSNWDGFV
jgi:hypothetical protein